MKHPKMSAAILLLILTIPVLSHSQTTQPSERAAVEDLIQIYFDGWATGDTTKLGRAMHSSCHLKFYREGRFTILDRATYLSLFKLHPRSKDLVTQIVGLDLTGNTGRAKAE